MATIASLQIKIGADVTAAINGLNKASFAAEQVKEAYIKANDATVKGGFAIAGWAQNFSVAIGAVERDLEKVDLSTLDSATRKNTEGMLALATGALKVSESVTVAGSAFSGMQAIAGPAIAGIARLFPTIGASLAALAGPIGIAVGALAAGAALIVANWDLVAGSISDVEKITIEANKATEKQKATTLQLIDVLKSDISTRKDQAAAIDHLNDISPTYFAGLSKEKSTVDQINKAYEAYATNLDNVAKLQAINTEISGLYQQQVVTQIALQDATAQATAEQLRYNAASASAREGTKNALPLTLARNAAKAEEQKLAAISAQIGKYKDLAKVIPKTTTEPNTGGKNGKDVETEAQKISKVIKDLESELAVIQLKFKSGLIPEDFGPQVDAIQSALSKIATINPDSEAFQKLLNDYQAFANQQKLYIPFTPVIRIPENISILGELPDRVSDVAKKMQASFVKVNFALSFEEKANKAASSIQAEFEKIRRSVIQGLSVLGQFNDVFSNIGQAGFDKRSAALDDYYEKQKDIIDKTVSDEGLKNKKFEALEKEIAANKKAIKRDEAAANKRNAIFSAIINTARAIAEALPNVALSIAAGVLGAAQVAAIQATPLPGLQSGGLVRGRTTVVVGEYAGADNNPELISPVNKVKKYITEAVTESGGAGGNVQLYSFISGDDIILVSQRGAYRKSRVG